METNNQDKKIGVFLYELLGTAFIMYAVIVDQLGAKNGFGNAYLYITLAMMMIAWNVSGGHFNPAITIGVYVASKDFSGNALTCLLMIAGQFSGAILGFLFGYLALISKDYMEDYAILNFNPDREHNANIPKDYIARLYPTEQSITYRNASGLLVTNVYYPNWQVFWAMLMSGLILSLAYASIKMRSTQITDNHAVQAIAVFVILIGVMQMNRRFGTLGYNPALACA